MTIRRPLPLEDSTLPPKSLTADVQRSGGPEGNALVVLWSRDEPSRMGEVLLVPDDGAAWTFGRREPDPSARRLALIRQRPGASEATGPLECPRISRAQLRVFAGALDTLSIENLGGCPLLFRGRAVDGVALGPGDVVELHNELLLLCARRPAMLPAIPGDSPLHRFGEADAFGLVGESPAAWELRRRTAAAARGASHVLVLGPSGSGKELVARAIHGASDRTARPLVARNAATIPEGIADAELFGNLRSYPNPGTPERPGLVGQADGGTLFLDEIAELPERLQAHLLRVLDDGEYHRLGEATGRRADLRLVGATNRPAEDLKHDLLARLRVRLTVPDLNARREDVPLLVAHLLRRHAAADPALARRFFDAGSPIPRVSPALMRALAQHRYTTHVRELSALLLRAALDSHGRYLELTEELAAALDPTRAPASAPAEPFTPEEQRRLRIHRKHRFRATSCSRDPEYAGNRQTADLHLRQLLCKALRVAGWDAAEAAARLAEGGDADLRQKAAARIDRFLANLRARLAAPGATPDAIARSLAREWRGSADDVLAVLAALREGKIRGAAAAVEDTGDP